MKVLIQALMVSVIAWVLPTNIYKVPLLLLGMKPQLFFLPALVDSDMVESLLLITHTHTVNLTSNLIELWLFFAALVLFTLPMTVFNYSSSSRLISIDPSRSKLLGLLSPLAKQARTPSLHSLYFTFIQLSPPPTCSDSPKLLYLLSILFLSFSFSPSHSKGQVRPDKFENSFLAIHLN